MYITDRHTCFAASSGSVSFSLPHKAKQTVKKLLQGVGSGDYLLLYLHHALCTLIIKSRRGISKQWIICHPGINTVCASCLSSETLTYNAPEVMFQGQ